MEDLEVKQFSDCYRHRSVLVTGHTGFKGSWLITWLQKLGANVHGVALDPHAPPSHWGSLKSEIPDYRLDIRDYEKLQALLDIIKPEMVFHLAAQALVRRSYQDPLESWSTNVMGTANILEACRHCESVRAIVVATTDKVYRNNEWAWGYREVDPLGGRDPYSASKSACEMLIDSYRKSYFRKKDSAIVASVRAGNVIGGGDWSLDRIVPDIVRAVTSNQSIEIRNPLSTRPWQHVLDCLSGYLILGEKMISHGQCFGEAWNFGPEPDCNKSVRSFLERMRKYWPAIKWHVSETEQPHEAKLLYLDSSKARNQLSWRQVWNLEQSILLTVEWYRSFYQHGESLTARQLNAYIQQASESGCSWVSIS